MAIKVRASQTYMTHGEDDDPAIFVSAEVFEDTLNQVIAPQTFQYSLAGMAGMTAQQKRQRVRDDVLAWASTVKTNAAAAAPILTLMGVAVDIPDEA